MELKHREAPPGFNKMGVGVLGAVLFLLMAWTLPAQANTGAGATILNVAQVDYDDASGTTSFIATASTFVTVNTVEAAGTVSGRPVGGSAGDTAAIPANQTVASGANAVYHYALTSNANGSDIYDFTANTAITANANVAGQTMTYEELSFNGTVLSTGAATVTLGGSVIVGVPAANQLTIPGGSAASAGIAVNDVVVVNGEDFVVTALVAGNVASHTNLGAVAQNTQGVTTAETVDTLTFAAYNQLDVPLGVLTYGSNTAPAFAVGLIGSLIREQRMMRVTITATANNPPTNGTVDHDMEIAPDGNAGLTASVSVVFAADQVTTFTAANLTITKVVRNVTAGGGFAANATGDPGDVLEYQVTITNAGGDATSVVLTDAVPTYSTLQVFTNAGGFGVTPEAFGATSIFAEATDNGGVGTSVDLTTQNSDTEDGTRAVGDAAAAAAGSALTMNLGNGATNAAGGTVTNAAPNNSYVILYRVTID